MTKRPNILIVCTDQQRTDTLSCYGAKHINTPGFDRIAQEGTRFDRAYAASAVCTPSRVSLLSGQYPSRHRVWNIGVNTGDDVRMMQHDLRDAGYRTGLIGKAHLEAYQASKDESRESVEGWAAGYDDWGGPYYGFDEVQLALGHVNYGMSGHYGAWLRRRFSAEEIEGFKTLLPRGNHPPFGGEGYDWSLPVEAHNSVWTGDRAVEFIECHTREDPFFLFVSFQDPHHPHALPRGFDNPVSPQDVPDQIRAEGELDQRPPHFRIAHEGRLAESRFVGDTYPMIGQGHGADFRTVPDAAARDGKAQYFGMVSLIDRQLERIWTALDDTGLTDNTLVIVTSDHGELLGDHGLWMKGPFHYEPVIRVPMLMRGPKGIESQSGRICAHPVSLVDILPTCRETAGLPAAVEIDGQSLFEPSRDRHILVETVQDWHALRCVSLVTAQYKLTFYPDEKFGELTDLHEDPNEFTNLFDTDPQTRAELLQLATSHYYRLTASSKSRISYA